CRPCPSGCVTCQDDTPCLIQEDPVLRAAVLSCQACCMLAIFLSMLVAYHFRRSKASCARRIRTSGIVLLETILFGSLLLYFPVFILYFKPSVFRCIVLRWVRLLGFATVYGTITLKLYRCLGQGLGAGTPAGGRVWGLGPPQGGGLGLGTPAVGRIWVLGPPSWGGLGLGTPTVGKGLGLRTPRVGRGFSSSPLLCPTAEMLFLLWGSFLCYATRAVPSAFHEPRYMGIALHNELLVSAAFHVVRIWVPRQGCGVCRWAGAAVGPGTALLVPCRFLIDPPGDAPCSPQFLHSGSPLREEITAEVYEDELDMRRSGSCMNSSVASAWSEHSLDPDDIREELKKLYRQLEAHRTWRMATNNPHLGKRRSSR
ncbi:GP158 protein, partial [Sterrhoptilus dennistouni]|nr:GP158 protein [Sterrhoptilus dennistouni]